MKLTKYDKEVFVRAVMADVKEPDAAKIQEDIQSAMVSAMSTEVQAIYTTHPKALNTGYVNNVISGYGAVKVVIGDANASEVTKPWREANEARYKCQRDLESAIKGITTLKKLQDSFPELVKYMPTENETTNNLPALSNVVANLVKIGWKGEAA